jgi:hypothetical protein
MSVLLRISCTVPLSVLLTIICPFVRAPVTLYVPDAVMVTVLPSTVAVDESVVIELEFKVMLRFGYRHKCSQLRLHGPVHEFVMSVSVPVCLFL